MSADARPESSSWSHLKGSGEAAHRQELPPSIRECWCGEATDRSKVRLERSGVAPRTESGTSHSDSTASGQTSDQAQTAGCRCAESESSLWPSEYAGQRVPIAFLWQVLQPVEC